MSHTPSLLFPSHLSTASLSTCTPVRPSTRPSTRPSLLSASHGDLPCADPSNVSFGSLAETHSPTGYEPKDLTQEDTSTLVKPMFFHRPSMTSTCDSAESIATLPPESVLDDQQIRKMLASPLYLQEREARRVYLRFRENSMLSSSHFRDSAGKPAAVFSHKRKSSQETLSDREGISSGRQPVQGKDEALSRFSGSENGARLALEEQRDHLLAEAKSEVLKQECRADFLDCSFRELNYKFIPIVWRLIIPISDMTHLEETRLHEELAQRDRALRETHTKSIHEVEELKRAQEMRIDQCSRQELRES